jgi:hypothetical protein
MRPTLAASSEVMSSAVTAACSLSDARMTSLYQQFVNWLTGLAMVVRCRFGLLGLHEHAKQECCLSSAFAASKVKIMMWATDMSVEYAKSG